jgi:hypothetical protein
MAEWDADYPGPDDEVEANTIHTHMQAVKSLLSERMRARSGDNAIDEHNVCQEGEDGLHPISKIGFVKQHTSVAAMTSWLGTYGKRVGSLHAILSSGYPMYIVDEGGGIVLLATVDHSLLTNLTDLLCHTGLFALDGSRSMAGDVRMAAGKTFLNQSYGSGDTDALNPTHVDEDWYAAHGSEALRSRHFIDNTLEISALNGKTLTYYVEDAANDAHGVPFSDDGLIWAVTMGRNATGSYFSVGGSGNTRINVMKEACS